MAPDLHGGIGWQQLEDTLTLLRWNPDWKLWAYSNCPLVELEWGPRDFEWKHDGRLHHFFNYNTKLSQAIQNYKYSENIPYAMVGGH